MVTSRPSPLAAAVAVSWARYIDDMRTFQRETLPLLKQAGLR